MKYSASLDHPLARRALERVVRPFEIWCLFILVMLASGVFLTGVVLGGVKGLARISLPDSTVMVLLGAGAFAFFFPFFLCLSYSRILLRAVEDLEQRIESLKHAPERE